MGRRIASSARLPDSCWSDATTVRCTVRREFEARHYEIKVQPAPGLPVWVDGLLEFSAHEFLTKGKPAWSSTSERLNTPSSGSIICGDRPVSVERLCQILSVVTRWRATQAGAAVRITRASCNAFVGWACEQPFSPLGLLV